MKLRVHATHSDAEELVPITFYVKIQDLRRAIGLPEVPLFRTSEFPAHLGTVPADVPELSEADREVEDQNH